MKKIKRIFNQEMLDYLMQHGKEHIVKDWLNIVNLKFNENTLATTIAPREMEKDEFRYGLKEHMNDIKQILNESLE